MLFQKIIVYKIPSGGRGVYSQLNAYYERTAYWNRIERHDNASALKLRCTIASFARVRKGAEILFKQFKNIAATSYI